MGCGFRRGVMGCGGCGRFHDHSPRMPLVAVAALERLECHVVLEQVGGFEGDVVTVGDLDLLRVDDDGTFLLVDAGDDHRHGLGGGRILDVDASILVHGGVCVEFHDALLAFERGELERPVARIGLRIHHVAVVALDLGLVARLRVDGGAVLAVVADGQLVRRRRPIGARRFRVCLAFAEQEQCVVLDGAHEFGVVA